MPDQFWKVDPEPHAKLVVHLHFCPKCGCLGPCECWLDEQLEQMERERKGQP